LEDNLFPLKRPNFLPTQTLITASAAVGNP
jgi:hypothetical protein